MINVDLYVYVREKYTRIDKQKLPYPFMNTYMQYTKNLMKD